MADQPIHLDPRRCYEVMRAHDRRFDGVFYVGVSTTGVYCRPVCRVRMPRADRCSFYPNAASAERAGYRPCLRCRPELAPGLAPSDAVKRVAQQAAARIKAGALSDGDLEALALEFGLSSRQLRRAVETEYGVSPIELALTFRLLLAKQLLTDTQLKVIDVAFASGFSSLRRFNDAFRAKYRLSPSSLRKRKTAATESGVMLRLGYRPPLAWLPLVRFLSSRGATRIEKLEGARYFRTARIGQHIGWFAAEANDAQHQVMVEVSQSLVPALTPLSAKLRHLFDLDASPTTIEAHLKGDRRLAPLLRRTPGLRLPGALDSFEVSLRAVLGQQISVKAATTIFGRFVERFGAPVETPVEGLDRVAPLAADVAAASAQDIISLGLTAARATTVRSLARAFAEGGLVLHPGMRASDAVERLQHVPGIGPWTAHYIAMRVLGDPDAFPHSDLGLMHALEIKQPKEILATAETWRPWRAYAAIHLWHGLAAGG
jgi:AraC family transcriptional regulator, regulatory protein of adaptative response / DNA-3-methyladenine glycosylase II